MKPARNSAGVRLNLIRTAALLIWGAISLGPSVARAQPSAASKGALVLYWYNKDYPWNVKFDQSFQAALRSASSGAVEYYPEYLETNRFPGERQSLLLRDYLRRKYEDRTIDVVVANSDASLDFLLKYRDYLFPHTPIVFVAARHPTKEELAAGPGLTGVINVNAHRKTLDLALRLHPGTEQVFIISGTLQHEKKFETLAREELQGYENRVRINYLTDYSPNELIAKMKSLPERSIVLYVWQQSQNEQGRVLESAEIFASIAGATPVPIYGMSNQILGNGIVGGYIITSEATGTKVAEIALRIANGARAQDVPVESAPTMPMFDWRQLKRWGISEDSLPPGSIVRNRELSVWDLYRGRIVGVTSLCVVEALLIIALLAQRARRRRVEEALRDNEERLKLALSAANMGAWDWRVDTGELKWSDEMRQIFGVAGGNALTTKSFLDLIHPDDRPAVLQAVTRTINQGAPYDIEFRTIHQDGGRHWVMGKGKALLDKAGQASRMLGVNMDITDRKRAEERLRSYFELPLIGMAITSPDRRFVEVNQKLCDILGHSVDQLTGMSWVDVTHPDDVAENIRLLEETMRGKTEGYVMDKRFIHRDGHIVYASISARCARRADRTVDYLTLIVQDITQRKQAEDRLMESEAQLRLLTELIPQHVWTTIPDDSADFRNRRWLDYTGMTIEEVRQKGWMTALHPDDHNIVINAIREASLRKGIYEVEIRLKGVDGQYRWFLTRAIPQLDQDGNIIKWYGTNTDIEDRKQAEQALRESEERYRSVVESQTELICRYLPDTTLTFVNDAYCRYFSKTQEALIGTKFLDLIPESAREVTCKHIESLVENPRVEIHEHEVLLPNGGVGWQQWVDHAILGASGRVVEFQAVGRDITERKQIEEGRREGEERLRLALEAGRMGVWEWDTRTNAVKWSKEHYTVMGFMPYSVEPDYHTWADRVHPDDLQVAMGAIKEAIEEEKEYRCEYRIVWPDGSLRWVEGRGKPVYDKGGRCLKVSGLIVDITERKEAEEALRESEEALRKSYARIEDLAGRLIAAQEEERRYVARELHDDLNQQVAALAIGISRLKRQLSNADAVVLEQIAKLRGKTDLLSERIRQVSHELHSSILQHVGLPAALNSYCAEFSDLEGIAVALDIGDGVEAVPPDAALCLYRVAQESLRNVARHSGARRAVVTLAGVNGAVELRVTDQGAGFDPGQARECRGLGLVSMEERVKLLHGSFVLTTRPGAGTELRAQIPLRRGHEQNAGIVG